MGALADASERVQLLPRSAAAAAAGAGNNGAAAVAVTLGSAGGSPKLGGGGLGGPPRGSHQGLLSLAGGGASSPLLQRLWASSGASRCASAGVLRVLAAAAVSGAWMFVSSLLILVNKHILKDLGFGYPMTVAGMGMFTSGALSYFVIHGARLAEARAVVTASYWARNIMPVGFFMAGTLWAGNLVYLYLSVSFIQMLKSFTPVITMVALFVARMETPTPKMISSVLCIAGGTAMAAYGEIHNSALGLLIMLASEALEAIRLVMTQLLLTGHKMGPFEGLMWLAPACCAWLLLGAAVVEWPAMVAAGHHTIPGANAGLFLLAACLGFAVNTLAYATIKLASSLTLKVLGCIKNTLVIVAAVLLYAEQVTALQGAGYAVSTGAFLVYVHIKMVAIAAGEGAGGGGPGGGAERDSGGGKLGGEGKA